MSNSYPYHRPERYDAGQQYRSQASDREWRVVDNGRAPRPSYDDSTENDHRRSTAGPSSRRFANSSIKDDSRDRQMSSGSPGSHNRDRRRSPATDARRPSASNEPDRDRAVSSRPSTPRGPRTERERKRQATETPASSEVSKSAHEAMQQAASDFIEALVGFEPTRLELQEARKKFDQMQNLRNARDKRGEEETPIHAEQFKTAKERLQAVDVKVQDAKAAILKAHQEVQYSIIRSTRNETKRHFDDIEKSIPSPQLIRKTAEDVGDSVRKDITSKEEIDKMVKNQVQSMVQLERRGLTSAFLTKEEGRILMRDVADEALKAFDPPPPPPPPVAPAASATAMSAPATSNVSVSGAAEPEEGEVALDDSPVPSTKPRTHKDVRAVIDARYTDMRHEMMDHFAELSNNLADLIKVAIEDAQEEHRAKKRKAFEAVAASSAPEDRQDAPLAAAKELVDAVFGAFRPAELATSDFAGEQREQDTSAGTNAAAGTAESSDRIIAPLPRAASKSQATGPSSAQPASGQAAQGGSAPSNEALYKSLAEERKRNDDRFSNVSRVMTMMRDLHREELEGLKTSNKAQKDEIEKLQAEIARLGKAASAGPTATLNGAPAAPPQGEAPALSGTTPDVSTLRDRLDGLDKSLSQCTEDLLAVQETCKFVPRLNSRLNKHKEMIDMIVENSKNTNADLTYITALFAGIPEVSNEVLQVAPNGAAPAASNGAAPQQVPSGVGGD
ncbi:hypothetical protein CBOM_05799 [Ceraceosorus bombacis]|uniref:Uncharacterized protein n=1 Tax=Ceraceosorus bombacis TaxID=401625 RepID=A0A0P1BSC7_9BASI|nr:hypothetical protein CBOM_05799 [Ceraceosorus bombacis]